MSDQTHDDELFDEEFKKHFTERELATLEKILRDCVPVNPDQDNDDDAQPLTDGGAATPTSHNVTEHHESRGVDSVTLESSIDPMSHNVTEHHGFNEKQLHALDRLASGMSCTDVAKSLGVARETVSRWKNLPQFRTELTTAVQDSRDMMRVRLSTMAEMALKIIDADLRSSDKFGGGRRLHTAFQTLQLMAYSRVGVAEKPVTGNDQKQDQKNVTQPA